MEPCLPVCVSDEDGRASSESSGSEDSRRSIISLNASLLLVTIRLRGISVGVPLRLAEDAGITVPAFVSVLSASLVSRLAFGGLKVSGMTGTLLFL